MCNSQIEFVTLFNSISLFVWIIRYFGIRSDEILFCWFLKRKRQSKMYEHFGKFWKVFWGLKWWFFDLIHFRCLHEAGNYYLVFIASVLSRFFPNHFSCQRIQINDLVMLTQIQVFCIISTCSFITAAYMCGLNI